MFGMDEEALLLVIQVVSLVLITVQYIPQIKSIYQDKEEAVKNLSMESWVYKVLFSVFFVLTLFLSETTLIVAVGQFINLSFSAVVLGQIVYYSHIEVVPKPHIGIIPLDDVSFFKDDTDEFEDKDYHLVPILHNLIKQLYVFNKYEMLPIQLY